MEKELIGQLSTSLLEASGGVEGHASHWVYCFDLARLTFHLISSRPSLILLFAPREVPSLLHPSF